MWYCLRSGADSRCSSRSSCSNESRNNRCKPQILGNAFCRGISAAPYAVFPTFLSALLGRQIARLTAVACWTNVILFASAESFTEVRLRRKNTECAKHQSTRDKRVPRSLRSLGPYFFDLLRGTAVRFRTLPS
uniref:Centromere protein M n=1 Tax=Parascaris univalens TaxID=6257 RepID=A0A914ZZJ1_PARUN